MKKEIKRDLEIENYKREDTEWKPIHRLEAKCIDAPAIIRGIPKTLPPHDSFLAYLEFRANQKPTVFERIFGKRLL